MAIQPISGENIPPVGGPAPPPPMAAAAAAAGPVAQQALEMGKAAVERAVPLKERSVVPQPAAEGAAKAEPLKEKAVPARSAAWEMMERGFDPQHRDPIVGLDPYHLMQRKGPRGPKPALPAGLEQPPGSNDIPKNIHCIWMGQPINRRGDGQLWKNVLALNESYKAHGFTLYMWCNESAMADEEFRKSCRDNGIVLLNIFDVFAEGELPLEGPIHYCLHSIPPNYGEASDMLRYAILHRFGGIYLDEDTAGTIVDTDKERAKAGEKPILVAHHERASSLEERILFNAVRVNDYFVSRPHHPYFKAIIEEIEKEYKKQPEETDILIVRLMRWWNVPTLLANRTIERTGPGMSHIFFDRTLNSNYKHECRLFEYPSAGSWIPKNLHLKPTDLPALVTTLLRELKEFPNRLILYPYEKSLGETVLREVVLFLAEKFPEQFSKIQHCYSRYQSVVETFNNKLLEITKKELPQPEESPFEGWTMDEVRFVMVMGNLPKYAKQYGQDLEEAR